MIYWQVILRFKKPKKIYHKIFFVDFKKKYKNIHQKL